LRLRHQAFITDENVHPDVVGALRRNGCDVLDVKESGFVGASDLVILRIAREENRIVLTHDSDFGRLAIANSEPILGIVYLRPGHISPAFTLETLEVVFREVDEVASPFILVAERAGDRIKIRLRSF
jgi:predicted nuclease of predicted toxin-antitoxin system